MINEKEIDQTYYEIQVKGPRAAVVDRLRRLDQPFSICYEADLTH